MNLPGHKEVQSPLKLLALLGCLQLSQLGIYEKKKLSLYDKKIHHLLHFTVQFVSKSY